MKYHIKWKYVILLMLLLGVPYWGGIKAQTFIEELQKAEAIRLQYGENNDKYLDALTTAIQAAFGEEKYEEANKYRLIHSNIIKEKYGETSLEYAEDLWRVGNVSKYKGEDYTYNCYHKAGIIYENLKAESEYPYCDIMYQTYNHYYNQNESDTAAIFMKKYLLLCESWIDKEWKGLYVSPINLASNYTILGIICQFQLNDYHSAMIAHEKSLSIIEKYDNLNQYEYSWMSYMYLSKLNVIMGDYRKASIWQKKYLNYINESEGSFTEDYLLELSNLRDDYLLMEDYDSTAILSEELLTRIGELENKNGHSSLMDSLYNKTLTIFWTYNDNRNIIKYAPVFLSALETYNQKHTQEYICTLYLLIFAHHNLDNYKEERSLYKSFEEIASQLRLTETEDYWHFLSLKVEAFSNYSTNEEYYNAISEWESLTESLFGKDSKQYLLVLYHKAHYFATLKQNQIAGSIIENCYTLIQNKEWLFDGLEDSLIILSDIHQLDGILLSESDAQIAEAQLLKSVEEGKVINYESGALLSLGNFYYQTKRDFKKAVYYFELAKQSVDNKMDNNSIQYISILNNMAVCYQQLGCVSKAISIYDNITTFIENKYGCQNDYYLKSQTNKGSFYMSISSYSDAIQCFQSAKEQSLVLYGEGSVEYATSLINLESAQITSGDLSNSKKTLETAIQILDHYHSPLVVYAYMNLLSVYALEHDTNSIYSFAKKADEIIKDNQLEGTDISASLYGTIGYALSINNKQEGADYCRRALEILKTSIGENNLSYFGGYLVYCLSLFNTNSITSDIIPNLLNLYKNIYQNEVVFLNESERESFIMGSRYSQVKNILFSSSTDESQNVQLYDFLLYNKGLLLETNLELGKAVYNSGNIEVINNYEELIRLKRILEGDNWGVSQDYSYSETKNKSSLLEREIIDYLRGVDGYLSGLEYTYTNIESALKNDEIAIEFITYNDLTDNSSDAIYYAALLARKGWSKPKFVKLCKTVELERIIESSPALLYGKTSISQSAYNFLWQPLIAYLTDIKTIYYSPYGRINNMAVECLYNGNERFNELYDIIRLSSTREIFKINEQPPKYSSVVLYGGLIYDEDDDTMIMESKKHNNSPSYTSELYRGFSQFSTRKGWEYLPGSLQEVNQINRIITQSNIQCALKTDSVGNEESFKALSGNDINVLHIATHGFYYDEINSNTINYYTAKPLVGHYKEINTSPLQRSGLLLSGCNKAWMGQPVPRGVEDGVLTASEIAILNLNSCDLVVLSACETALGEITDEGVFGLQRAFKNAGVNTIVMSLWEVNDQVTSLMMQEFYKNLMQGITKRESFKIAQDKVRKEYPDPRYWAAFIMLD